MKFVANDVNGSYFRFVPENAGRAAQIDAAVAYITDDSLFEAARNHQIPFRIWCRIDEEVSLRTLEILEKNLHYPRCQLYATHDFLHCKIVWMHGFGCYIGSANLTRKALLDNIEIGVFVEESADESEFFREVKTFFDSLQDYTSPILIEDIRRIRSLFERISKDLQTQEANARLKDAKAKYMKEWEDLKAAIFKDQRTPFKETSATSRHEKRYIDEWKRCQKLLTDYTEIYRTSYARPAWVDADVPYAVEIDRMFGWYYSHHIQGDRRVEILVEEHHERSRGKGDEKIRELFSIWSDWREPPDESIRESFDVRAPVVRALLGKEKIRHLSLDEVSDVVVNCYALMDHIDQFKSYEDLGLERGSERVPREVKATRFAERYLSGPNKHGKTFLEVLYYFIWDSSAPPWEKIWKCTNASSKWKYPGIDRSTLGELIGLARPDEYPIRNNRTSRVLYALGFEVDHF